MLTPKPREAVLTAFHAPGVTLQRCCGGFFDPGKGPQSHKVTIRTANTLIDAALAVFDDPCIPTAFTLTPAGIAEGRRIAAEIAAKAEALAA